MLEFLVEGRRVFDGVELPVDLQALEAGPLPFGDFLAVFALAATNDGSQKIEPLALWKGDQLVDHHRDGLALNGQAGGRRIGHPDAGPKQAHIVVNLSDRADCGARIATGGLLLDGDGGRQAFDQVHIGLAHQFQELAGIGREAFDVATLTLSVDSIERQ